MPGFMRFRGIASAKRGVAARIKAAEDFTPVWLKIDRSVSLMFRRQFATAGSFGGSRWARLRPATRRVRPRPGGNRGGLSKPLWDTGRLKASLESVGSESIRSIRPDRYARGTRVPYASLHQQGFTVTEWGGRKFRTPRSVPARHIIPDPVPSFLSATWARIAAKHVGGG